MESCRGSDAPARLKQPGILVPAGLAAALLVFWVARILPAPRDVLPLEAADLFLYFLPSYTYVAERLQALAVPAWPATSRKRRRDSSSSPPRCPQGPAAAVVVEGISNALRYGERRGSARTA